MFVDDMQHTVAFWY